MDYENRPPEEDSGFYHFSNMPPLSPAPKKKPKAITAGMIAVCLVFGLIGGGLGAVAVNKWMSSSLPQPNASQILEGVRPDTVLQLHQIDTSKQMTPAEVYAANVSSTVGITTSITTNFWGYQTTSAASGSGFILSADGYILTNFHVVENSSAITVSLYDDTAYEATLVGYDKQNDIAILKVNAQGLTPVILGNSDNMNVGDNVVAIGNPLGELTFSLTAGTVSALNRQVTMSNGVTMNLIQTDCAINSGNSGGALFNLYGEVVGITNAKYSSSSSGASIDNIGFAIPMNEVRHIIESIIEKGYIAKPYIGVSVQDVGTEAQSFGLPQGAAVVSVSEGSPAESAGLQVRDIITHVNGSAITGSNALVSILKEYAIGEDVSLTVYRQGQTLELTVTVGQQIQPALDQTEQTQQPQRNPFGS